MNTNKGIRWMRLAAAAAGMYALLLAAPARADAINVPVNANVVGVCKFSSGQSPSVAIANSGANIDPTLAGSATGSANILYKCTNGTNPAFSITSAGGTTLTLTCGACAGTPTMDATLALSAPVGAGQGFAAPDQTITLTGTIPAATYSTAAVGNYTSTATVTVTP